MNEFSRLQELLYLINNNEIPLSILPMNSEYFFNEFRRKVTKEILKKQREENNDKGSEFLNRLINDNDFIMLIKLAYEKLSEFGINTEIATKIILYTLSEKFTEINDIFDFSDITAAEKILSKNIKDTLIIDDSSLTRKFFIRDLARYKKAESHLDETSIRYGKEIGLVFWNNSKWQLTNIGLFVLSLPIHDFIKTCLLLEIVHSRANQYCMTEEFIRALDQYLEDKEVEFEPENLRDWILENKKVYYTLALVRSWLNRLSHGGVLLQRESSKHKFRLAYRLSKIGKLILDDIATPENSLYYPIIVSLLKEQDPPLEFGNIDTKIQRYLDFPQLEKFKTKIKEAIELFRLKRYSAVVTSLLPVIEGVTREIFISSKLGGTNEGLKSMLGKLRGAKCLSERTEALVKAIGRDNLLHGLESLKEEYSASLANLSFVSLIELVRDYQRHLLFRKGLEMICDKERELSFNELIKAYPDNRNLIHVQFLSDNKLRVTINRAIVYLVIKENNEVSIQKL